MEENPSPWRLIDHFPGPRGEMILHVDIQYSNLTNVIVERPQKDDEMAPWQARVFQAFDKNAL
jgi:hypothetical protein